jgi:hypothetical protein
MNQAARALAAEPSATTSEGACVRRLWPPRERRPSARAPWVLLPHRSRSGRTRRCSERVVLLISQRAGRERSLGGRNDERRRSHCIASRHRNGCLSFLDRVSDPVISSPWVGLEWYVFFPSHRAVLKKNKCRVQRGTRPSRFIVCILKMYPPLANGALARRWERPSADWRILGLSMVKNWGRPGSGPMGVRLAWSAFRTGPDTWSPPHAIALATRSAMVLAGADLAAGEPRNCSRPRRAPLQLPAVQILVRSCSSA